MPIKPVALSLGTQRRYTSAELKGNASGNSTSAALPHNLFIQREGYNYLISTPPQVGSDTLMGDDALFGALDMLDCVATILRLLFLYTSQRKAMNLIWPKAEHHRLKAFLPILVCSIVLAMYVAYKRWEKNRVTLQGVIDSNIISYNKKLGLEDSNPLPKSSSETTLLEGKETESATPEKLIETLTARNAQIANILAIGKEALEKEDLRGKKRKAALKFQSSTSLPEKDRDALTEDLDFSKNEEISFIEKCKEVATKYKSVSYKLLQVKGTSALDAQYEVVLVTEASDGVKAEANKQENTKKWWSKPKSALDRWGQARSMFFNLVLLYMTVYWVTWVGFCMAEYGTIEVAMVVPGNYLASLFLTVIIPALLFSVPYIGLKILNKLESDFPVVEEVAEEPSGWLASFLELPGKVKHNSGVAWLNALFFKIKVYKEEEGGFLKTALRAFVLSPIHLIRYMIGGVASTCFAVYKYFIEKNKGADHSSVAKTVSVAPLDKPDAALKDSEDLAKDLSGLLGLVDSRAVPTPLLKEADAASAQAKGSSDAEPAKPDFAEKLRLARLKSYHDDYIKSKWAGLRRTRDIVVAWFVMAVLYFVVSQITLWAVSDAWQVINGKSLITSPIFNANTFGGSIADDKLHFLSGLNGFFAHLTIGQLIGFLLFTVPLIYSAYRVWNEKLSSDGAWAKLDKEVEALQQKGELGNTKVEVTALNSKNNPYFGPKDSVLYLFIMWFFLGSTGVLMLRFMAQPGMTHFLPFHEGSISNTTFYVLSGILWAGWGVFKLWNMHLNARTDMRNEDLNAHSNYVQLKGKETPNIHRDLTLVSLVEESQRALLEDKPKTLDMLMADIHPKQDEKENPVIAAQTSPTAVSAGLVLKEAELQEIRRVASAVFKENRYGAGSSQSASEPSARVVLDNLTPLVKGARERFSDVVKEDSHGSASSNKDLYHYVPSSSAFYRRINTLFPEKQPGTNPESDLSVPLSQQ